MKIFPRRAELFRAEWRTDGRTDRDDEANSRFSAIFAKAPKKGIANNRHNALQIQQEFLRTSKELAKYFW